MQRVKGFGVAGEDLGVRSRVWMWQAKGRLTFPSNMPQKNLVEKPVNPSWNQASPISVCSRPLLLRPQPCWSLSFFLESFLCHKQWRRWKPQGS